MQTINNLKYKYNCFKELMIIALPVLIGELGHMLTGVADVAVISRYSTDALGAVNIANSILFTIFIFGLGIQNAVSIVLSKMRGEKSDNTKYFSSTLLFSFLLSIVFLFISLLSILTIDKMGFESNLIPDIKRYIFIIAFSMPGLFIFQGMKEFLQSFENVNVPNIILLSSVALNLLLNIVFIFGFGIVPAMGVTGAALTTLFVRYVIAFAILLYVLKLNFKFSFEFNFNFMKKLTLVGIPVGAAWMLEFLAFNLVTVLVGRIDGTLAATHGILTSFSSLTFALPSAIAIALCVKTAYHFGAEEPDKIKQYYKTALISGVGFMALVSGVMILFPEQILHIYTSDPEVIGFALPVITVLASYQVFDGLQTITGGLLKGFNKTGCVSLSVISSYWIIGSTVAYIMVTKFDKGLSGYWIALAVSLFTIGLVQAVYSRKILNLNDFGSLK